MAFSSFFITFKLSVVTGSHALSSLDSSMTTDSLNVIKNDGNATDDSGIDSIDQQSGNNSSPEPLLLRYVLFIFLHEIPL